LNFSSAFLSPGNLEIETRIATKPGAAPARLQSGRNRQSLFIRAWPAGLRPGVVRKVFALFSGTGIDMLHNKVYIE